MTGSKNKKKPSRNIILPRRVAVTTKTKGENKIVLLSEHLSCNVKNYLHRAAIECVASVSARVNGRSWNEIRKNKRRGRGRKVSFFSPNLVSRLRSEQERTLGTKLLLPLLFPLPPFVCLFVFFVVVVVVVAFLCFKFSRNNSSGNGCYVGSFRVRIFCHRVTKQTV